jgi:hypothetical protein
MTPTRITGEWKVSQYVIHHPYRLDLPAKLRPQLEALVLSFCKVRRASAAIEAMLGELTDCPPELLQALRMTLCAVLFFRPQRIDDNFFSRRAEGKGQMYWTTAEGLAYLEALRAGGVSASALAYLEAIEEKEQA